MKMNLELALTKSCTNMDCLVKLLKSGDDIEAKYSALVQNRIKIQPQQLVAIDTNLQIPEIIWRWISAIVIEVNENSVGIQGGTGKTDFASRVAILPLNLSIGDEVWFCKTDQDLEVHDLSIDGEPVHPQQLLEYITPIIERVYAT
jgi:hypothetical protein